MTPPGPDWFPDPSRRHELRFWDGSQWTAHVASAGVTHLDPLTAPPPVASASKPRRTRYFGWIGLLLVILAVAAAVVPGVHYARAESSSGVVLTGDPQQVDLPPNEKWGIYVNDADNSGYSESCSAVDSSGREVRMKDPSWSISSSDTEMLDLVFNTGSGKLTFTCSAPGERMMARPLPNLGGLLGGIAAGGVLGLAGMALLIIWLTGQNGRP